MRGEFSYFSWFFDLLLLPPSFFSLFFSVLVVLHFSWSASSCSGDFRREDANSDDDELGKDLEHRIPTPVSLLELFSLFSFNFA